MKRKPELWPIDPQSLRAFGSRFGAKYQPPKAFKARKWHQTMHLRGANEITLQESRGTPGVTTRYLVVASSRDRGTQTIELKPVSTFSVDALAEMVHLIHEGMVTIQ